MLKFRQSPNGNTVRVSMHRDRVQDGKVIGAISVVDSLSTVPGAKFRNVSFTCDLLELKAELDRLVEGAE